MAEQSDRAEAYEAGYYQALREIAEAAPSMVNALCAEALCCGFVILERRLADAQEEVFKADT